MVSVHFLDNMWDSIVVHLVVGTAEKNCVTNHWNKNMFFTSTVQSHSGFMSACGLCTLIQLATSPVEVWYGKNLSWNWVKTLHVQTNSKKADTECYKKIMSMSLNTYISPHLTNS